MNQMTLFGYDDERLVSRTPNQPAWVKRIQGSEFKVLRLQDQPVHELMETPEAMAEAFRKAMRESPLFNPDVECFYVAHLNTRRRLIGVEFVSHGTLDTILVHSRQVFRGAIVINAHSIILCHNHPSGDPSPSEADIKVTRDLQHGGRLLKIDLLDHIVLGRPGCGPEGRGWHSLRSLGYFC
jgi:DNA repair protein RadC